MYTNIRKNIFKYMIILHLASMILYIPATGAGYRHNILYDILCTAVIVLEIIVCRKDERHEMFWLFYIGVHFLATAIIYMSRFPGFDAGAWGLIVLFLTAPYIYICFSRVRSSTLLLVIEIAAVILLGYLLFITVRRLKKKKSNKQQQISSDPSKEPSN